MLEEMTKLTPEKPEGQSSSKKPSGSTRSRPEVILPQSRIKVIMKTSPEVENIGTDALYIITKATELFIDHIASTAYATSSNLELEYKNLAEIAQTENNMEFLKDILPRKMSYRIALQEMEKHQELLRQEIFQ